ncbi:MAG: secondary thiamine-phosphate synthase enzyme YjbQ [Phycisphaerae bacterium]
MKYRKMTYNKKLQVSSKGNNEVINITDSVAAAVNESGVKDGVVTVFVVGSTAAITTTEYEPGLVNYDLEAVFEKIAPANAEYEHEKTWHDDNGHSHVRASLVGPSITVPIVGGELTLGTWQQIILIDFDTRARNRTVVCQILS